jgi:hypothetical protein
MRLPIYLMLLLLLSCSQSQKHKVPYNELPIILEKFNTAFAEGNLAVLDSLTTKNYLHTNGNAKVISKNEWFDYLKKRSELLDSSIVQVLDYRLTEQKIEHHGTTSIVTGKVKVTTKDSLGTKEIQYRITNIWVYEDGLWKRAGFHDGKIE